MSGLEWALDIAVVMLLVGTSIRLLTTRDLLEAAILFIGYGLTLSLAWVRLGATDIALAEAALGAGVSGALFLNAFRRLTRRPDGAARSLDGSPPPGSAEPGVLRDLREHDIPGWLRWTSASATALVVGGLALLLIGLPERSPALPGLVDASLGESGATNPVTAVLLNFRAWDTVLEVTVVVAAVAAIWSLDRDRRPRSREPEAWGQDPVLREVTRLVVPLTAVVAVYLAWAGTHRPGGGFQAAALLAGGGVMAEVGGYLPPFSAASRPVRLLIGFGILAFLGVGLASLAATGSLLAYPDGWAHGLMLVVEGALTVAVAVALVEIFVDVPAVPVHDPAVDRIDPTGDPLGRMLDPGGPGGGGGPRDGGA